MESSFWYLSALVILTLLLHQGDSAPKTVMDHKVNLGWPNFFNPEMAILRKKGKKQKNKFNPDKLDDEETADNTTKINVDSLANITEEEAEEEISQEQSEEDVSSLIDYTMKGGLRGQLYLLNSTITMSELSEDLMESLLDEVNTQNSTEDSHRPTNLSPELQEKVLNEMNQTQQGETTEDGLRLRTPMIFKTHSPSLGKYGSLISIAAVENPVNFIYYGNWCGLGGRSAPIDNIDNCCLEHDKCYGRLVRDCPDVWQRPYNSMYAWSLINTQPICLRSESFCVNHVCDCDLQTASCFLHNLRENEIKEEYLENIEGAIEQFVKSEDQLALLATDLSTTEAGTTLV